MFNIHGRNTLFFSLALLLTLGVSSVNAGFFCCGDRCNNNGKPPFPPYDRPFPLGQVSDAFNEAQQTNAEAADFIMYDYEFVGETAVLNPQGRNHLIQIARRLPHVPFPIVIEMSAKTNDLKENQRLMTIDETRRANVVAWLQKFYMDERSMDPQIIANRVVIAPDFEYQRYASEAISDLGSSSHSSHSSRGGHGGVSGR